MTLTGREPAPALILNTGGFLTEVDENIHICCKKQKIELKGLGGICLTNFLVGRERRREACGDNEGWAGYYKD